MECPVSLAAGGAAGQAVGRPGRPVRPPALVLAAVAPVGGGQCRRRRHGALSRRDRRAGRRLAGAVFAVGAGAQRRPQVRSGGRPRRLGGVVVRRWSGRGRPAAGPPASRRRDPPSGDARFLLSAAVSDPATVGTLGDRSAGACRARPRADASPDPSSLYEAAVDAGTVVGVTAGDEGWLARVLAARADARAAAASAARQ